MNNVTIEMIKNALKYSHFCHSFNTSEKLSETSYSSVPNMSILKPRIREFYEKFIKNWDDCPMCSVYTKTYIALVKDLFLEINAEVDFTYDPDVEGYNELFNGDAVGDTCSLGSIYFLDGLYRLLQGENVDELMITRKTQLVKLLEDARMVARVTIEEKIEKLRTALDNEIANLQKQFTDEITSKSSLSSLDHLCLRNLEITTKI